MGAPVGNSNASKSRMFYDALRKNLVQNPHRVQTVVENLISAAEANEIWAIKELIDRIDGKAIQANTLENPDGSPLLSGIEITFVKPTHTNE
ncbi:hypothetical protein [Caudoviricetes sp.]|nr:hypothetical protein [Caudoviricetes sp.]